MSQKLWAPRVLLALRGGCSVSNIPGLPALLGCTFVVRKGSAEKRIPPLRNVNRVGYPKDKGSFPNPPFWTSM